jgi:hypothetical protein
LDKDRAPLEHAEGSLRDCDYGEDGGGSEERERDALQVLAVFDE